MIESEYRRNINPEVRETVQRMLSRVRGAALVYETSDLLQDEPADVDAVLRTITLALKQILGGLYGCIRRGRDRGSRYGH